MIGIIGGNGVAATNRLLQLIENKIVIAGAYRDAHHPEIITWQATQVPSRSMYLEGRGESFIPGYVYVGKQLKACGCTELCMCCNTAHFAITELEEAIEIPFINLLQKVAEKCHERGYKKIGMMCSDGLREIQLYDTYFKTIDESIQIIYPDEPMQKYVTAGICNSKNNIRNEINNPTHPKVQFSKVCDWFIQHEVDCIVGGCTDISAVFSPSHWKEVPYIDSLEILANVIYEKCSKTW